MKKRHKLWSVPSALLFFSLFISCSDFSSGGNVTQTGNPLITGRLLLTDGTAAAGATVDLYNRIVPTITDTLPVAVKTVETGADGIFEIDSVAEGLYVIEASDEQNNSVLIDSVEVTAAALVLPPDTLKPSGSVEGAIALEEGGDFGKIFVFTAGIGRFSLVEGDGRFSIGNLPEGSYDLRVIPIMEDYGSFDTAGVTVTAGLPTVLDTILLPFLGIPIPKNLSLSYDSMMQIVTLSWRGEATGTVSSYNVYRSNTDSNTVAVRINENPVNDTVFMDSTAVQDQSYEYRVASVLANSAEGIRSDARGVTLASFMSITDTITSGIAIGEFLLGRFAIDAKGNHIIVDNTANRLLKLGPSGNRVSEISITSFASDVAICDSLLCVSDLDRSLVLVRDGKLTVIDSIATREKPAALLFLDDTLYVGSAKGMELFYDGKAAGSLSQSFENPCFTMDFAADSAGRIFFTDGKRIYNLERAAEACIPLYDITDQKFNQNARIESLEGDRLALVTSNNAGIFESTILLLDAIEWKPLGKWKTLESVRDIKIGAGATIHALTLSGKILVLEPRGQP